MHHFLMLNYPNCPIGTRDMTFDANDYTFGANNYSCLFFIILLFVASIEQKKWKKQFIFYLFLSWNPKECCVQFKPIPWWLHRIEFFSSFTSGICFCQQQKKQWWLMTIYELSMWDLHRENFGETTFWTVVIFYLPTFMVVKPEKCK